MDLQIPPQGNPMKVLSIFALFFSMMLLNACGEAPGSEDDSLNTQESLDGVNDESSNPYSFP
jgi:hypothetical protein